MMPLGAARGLQRKTGPLDPNASTEGRRDLRRGFELDALAKPASAAGGETTLQALATAYVCERGRVLFAGD